MRVAILGLAPSTRHLAPVNDPDWEVWGLPWDEEYRAFMDRCFEMHDRTLLEQPEAGRSAEYWRVLREISPVYMQRAWDEIPGAIPFPLEDVRQSVFGDFPRKWDQVDWYNSSPAYMIALAIHEGAETIGLWGVDVKTDSEFAHERPCLEYLIGLAVGRGIEVVIPEGPTCLNKFQGEGIKLGRLSPIYRNRYGYV